ncbi:hypothetical protein GUJ93_ZPchr0009g341 [Zizania palustris]|uniref:Uncharacterized protein n=1 Tax=Zizania palustris TaxID=103762 RepID=A0A8J5S3Z6_ZIZPA|nr:hypothetical protein GUJ93_ZPchr0009g341 [Zizania palustris]KAG8049372.1 hypothetical protein GUJ93_ZPchr0009g341 [Zizania palustris]
MQMQGGGAAPAAVSVNGKDSFGNPARAAPSRSLPLKLLKPFLLIAVLATGVLAAGLLLPGASSYGLPRLTVPDVLAASRQTPCAEKGDGALERWTRPPASAWHNMTDEELLWVASMQPRVRRYPYRRLPKVAFMFLTRGPLPLAPLWERFFNGSGPVLFSVYVHSTPGYRPDFPPTSVFYRRQVPSQVARWGETNMFDAERRLLANALLDSGNERFVLVSETCVPLHGFPAVYRYLTQSRHSFVGSFYDPGPHGRGRYRAGLAPEVSPEQWRKGAQWFELERSLAVFVVGDDRYYPKFRELCRPPCYVDEHYLPTVLSIEAAGRIANRSVTWVDWSRGGAHPATFGEADVGEAFLTKVAAQQTCLYNGQPSEVCFLFARKFAPSALQPLLALAPTLLGY